MENKRVLEDFEQATAKHEMTVVVDDGLRRHLRFQTPGTWNYCFDVITWRGHLCYTGDLGTYVFSRIDDMFEFFRSRRDGYTINPDYWGEKLLAIDRHGGYREYSEELFKKAVLSHLDSAFKNDTIAWTDELKAKLKEEVNDRILSRAYEKEDALAAVRDFESYEIERPLAEDLFTDFYDNSLEDFTTRYILCCYALQWAIRMYDKSKEPKDEQAESQQGAAAPATPTVAPASGE